MLKLRYTTFFINPIIQNFISCRPLKTKSQNKMSKQVYKEIMKYVSPNAEINVKSESKLKVRAADVFLHPNANVLVAEIWSGGAHWKNCPVDVSVNVSEDEQKIDVNIINIEDQCESKEFHCELAVPVKAAIFIDANDDVFIEHMFGNEINVNSVGNIRTRDVRCEKIVLKSQSGNINCEGMLLGQKTFLETKENNSVTLDKLQGDEFTCKTDQGNIYCNCCYVEDSTFVTDKGFMELKNVHKKVKVFVNHPEGGLQMTGVHGNLQVENKGHKLDLQLSELHGESFVVADNVDSMSINISDDIEKSTELSIMANEIQLDNSLAYLKAHLTEQKQCFHNRPDNPELKLKKDQSKIALRSSNGTVTLGKLSWAELTCKSLISGSLNKNESN